MQIELTDLGWSDAFRRGLDDGALATTPPLRICDVHRDRLVGIGVDGERSLTRAADGSIDDVTVGDWVLHEPGSGRAVARLERSTLVHRAVGAGLARQAIAANVDTLMIVTGCDGDFNPARLERYLALSLASGAMPLIVLTKADLAADLAALRARAARLSPLATVVDLDARSADDVERLLPWLRGGLTAALVGSSGVGKTTLLNALTGTASATGPARRGDDRGRHTTTSRSLRATIAGGWLIDTPGMRELGLAEAADGIDAVFDDVAGLAARCRFPDCDHGDEPGCAVAAAIASGELDPERLIRWRKLRREDARHSASAAEARRRGREFGRRVRSAFDAKRHRRTDS